MKNKLAVMGMALALMVAASGCMAPAGNVVVPSSRIVGNLATGNFDLTLPKDHTVHKLSVRRQGSNVWVRLEDLKSLNNPDVVGGSYAGMAALIRENNQAMLAAFQAGLNAAATAAANAAKFAQPQPQPSVIYPSVTYP